MDTLAISGLDCEVSGDKSGKRARAARMEGQPTGQHNHPNKSLGQNPPPTQHGNRPDAKAQEGKGEDPKAGNGKGEKEKAKGKGKNKKKGVCSFFLSESGCNKGASCSRTHDMQVAAQDGRCFNCGAIGHRKDQCTRPKELASTTTPNARRRPAGRVRSC